VIEDVEDSLCGVYFGVFGWIVVDGCADFGVVICSFIIVGDGCYLFGIGGGIIVCFEVYDEYVELRWKVEWLL